MTRARLKFSVTTDFLLSFFFCARHDRKSWKVDLDVSFRNDGLAGAGWAPGIRCLRPVRPQVGALGFVNRRSSAAILTFDGCNVKILIFNLCCKLGLNNKRRG